MTSGPHSIHRKAEHLQLFAQAKPAGAEVTTGPQSSHPGAHSHGPGSSPGKHRGGLLSPVRAPLRPEGPLQPPPPPPPPRPGSHPHGPRSGPGGPPRPAAESCEGAPPPPRAAPSPHPHRDKPQPRGSPPPRAPQHQARPPHSSLGPRSSPTCNCSLRSLHPRLAASAGPTAIGPNRCPVSVSSSVTGVTPELWALVPPLARPGPAPVTSRAAAERRAQRRPPSPPLAARS
ncbi:basic salivary proline-rich protein 2-like [Vulpes lagopus]|uniref:basic salivary proline-rich protein 2-like n=1 Tax=Vulpes lagopus TaxID=494514 RepID=UPI001BC8D567|nr:basic salivary proline-rich protein 2-like [Vulpes lagopus]